MWLTMSVKVQRVTASGGTGVNTESSPGHRKCPWPPSPGLSPRPGSLTSGVCHLAPKGSMFSFKFVFKWFLLDLNQSRHKKGSYDLLSHFRLILGGEWMIERMNKKPKGQTARYRAGAGTRGLEIERQMYLKSPWSISFLLTAALWFC